MYGVLIKNNRECVKLPSVLSFLKFPKLDLLKKLSTKEKAAASEFTRDSKYIPKAIESQWYEWWESRNYFRPTKSENESFVVLLPPPNITGTLHLGHTLTATIQDVILRWRKMKGESVLWIPGVDHAGLATQVAVEKYIQQTAGLSRHDLGKEEFLKRVWQWKTEKERTIVEQLRNMGASLDWSSMMFTMSPDHSQFVTDSFIRLFNQGIIYRTESLVNWSCVLNSTISDIEIDWIDVTGRTKLNVPGYEKPIVFGVLYEFAYKVCDEDDEIVVSTTRPETMLGDVAVAVHPDNPAHSRFRNKQLWHPFRKTKIPVIFDEFVDMRLGSGAVKITPYHSVTDFEVSLRHGLPSIQVINEQGLIMEVGSVDKFHGIKRFDARGLIIKELKELGLFRGSKKHEMKVPICSRSGDVVELISKKQWFLKCKDLADQAIDAVKKGDLKLEPEKFSRSWFEWLGKIQDWNLSRQLWWGHRIPMYECKKGDKTIWVAAGSLEEARAKAGESFGATPDDVVQDPDVLDTWFSSALLPLNMSRGRTKMPPISMMVTGHDLLFFWVARMVMLNIQLAGELPFHHVFLHSLVCDSKGKKMSKSQGNVIQPEHVMNGCSSEEMKSQLESRLRQGLLTEKGFQQALDSQKKMYPNGIPECGADALRFTLCSRNILDETINFEVDICLANRHFCNKVWQAVNYLVRIAENYKAKRPEFDLMDLNSAGGQLNCFDRWILSRLAAAVKRVEENMPKYKFLWATQAIKWFLVQEFCDAYLESSKSILREAPALQHRATISVFLGCLETSLRLMAPFMPFLSEHLYHALPPLRGFDRAESITVAGFPEEAAWSQFRDPDLDACFEQMSQLLTVLRRMRTLFHLTEKSNVFIKCPDEMASLLFGGSGKVFGDLVKVEIVGKVDDHDQENIIKAEVSEECTAFIEHNHDKETLTSLLTPLLRTEGKLQATLGSLLVKTSAPNWNETIPSVKGQILRRITNLEADLNTIQKCKETIANCTRGRRHRTVPPV